MTTLIIGSGQLAYYLEKLYPDCYIAGLSPPMWHINMNGKAHRKFVALDISNKEQVIKVLDDIMPDVIINTAGITSIPQSFHDIPKCFEINFMGPLYILDWIVDTSPETKFVQCSSTEVYGPRDFMLKPEVLTGTSFIKEGESHHCLIKDERSPMSSHNPYGQSKIFSQNMVEFYRDIYKIKSSCAVFSNFESKMRDGRFVTSKIIGYIKRLQKNKGIGPLSLGNIDSVRSWMHASEAASGIKCILESEKSGDWVFSGHVVASIKFFLEKAFEIARIPDFESRYTIDLALKRDYEPLWIKPSSDLARVELDWQTTYSIEDIIT